MFKLRCILLSVFFVLNACSAPQSTYQKDRRPEARTEYNGLEGMAQLQKDQNYIMMNNARNYCLDEQVEMIAAEKVNDKESFELHKKNLKKHCDELIETTKTKPTSD